MNLLPIETAPKDGTWILLFGPSGYEDPEFRCVVGSWYEPVKMLVATRPYWQTHNGSVFEYENCHATHWCPIPSVPQYVVLTEEICVEMHGLLDAFKMRRSYVWLKSNVTMGVRFCPKCGTLPSSLWVRDLWIKDNPTVADLKLLLEACCI